jgi:uncharacterized damage-inducible protein DinB
MEMKQYLIDTFRYNDGANRKILESIQAAPEKQELIRFFSHLINSQKKWLVRIIEYPQSTEMSWWDPAYPLEQLEQEWTKSLEAWIQFLESKTEAQISDYVFYQGYDGRKWTAKLQDIALQLNYHSIHHRAQIQTMLRAQGLEPQFLDYIGTVYRRVE